MGGYGIAGAAPGVEGPWPYGDAAWTCGKPASDDAGEPAMTPPYELARLAAWIHSTGSWLWNDELGAGDALAPARKGGIGWGKDEPRGTGRGVAMAADDGRLMPNGLAATATPACCSAWNWSACWWAAQDAARCSRPSGNLPPLFVLSMARWPNSVLANGGDVDAEVKAVSGGGKGETTSDDTPGESPDDVLAVGVDAWRDAERVPLRCGCAGGRAAFAGGRGPADEGEEGGGESKAASSRKSLKTTCCSSVAPCTCMRLVSRTGACREADEGEGACEMDERTAGGRESGA
mgnify:CR=1 FL=1